MQVYYTVDIITPFIALVKEISIGFIKKQSEKFDVFMCKYLMDFDENNKANFSFYRERILKRSLGFVWEGFVHEVITPRGKVHYTNIEIEHRKIKKNSDANRNLNIYKKALKTNRKFSPREQYYYSRELFYHKKNILSTPQNKRKLFIK